MTWVSTLLFLSDCAGRWVMFFARMFVRFGRSITERINRLKQSEGHDIKQMYKA